MSLRPSPPTEASPARSAPESGPPGWLVLLLAVSCGMTVANLYYAQPLLPEFTRAFHISGLAAGALITVTQIGYAAGMVFLVPLGDRLESRRLVSTLLALTCAALLVAATAPVFPVLLAASLVSAATSVVVQILVPFAADLAPDATRGRIVGRVVSGLLTGILLSRTVGSVLADLTGWRVIYLASAVLMAVLAIALRAALPPRAPSTGLPYGRLLRTTVHLVRVHPALRRRALYQAAMFGAFSAFWTTISFVLAGAPFHYSQLGIGLFALVGAGGALVAPWAGRWADRGLTRPMTAVAFAGAALSFGVAGVGRHSVILLGVAAVLIDMAVQTTLVLGQHTIYALDPTARARLNSAYIATLFLGGAVGSQLGSLAYHDGGWTTLTVFGAALPVLGLLAWCTERRR
ncbi:MFS transporter [Actinoallomurus purpureus]|uniref:MFS transporter n=1 Tax=Actinoallomurus purpureus TaxID=478114 RepID=UPI002091F5B3|nr:MFS transporter [Actinoallomurus purpureus]MCO6007207.1 MFS transporter [Actinoallomurus purpureus]